MEHLNSARKPTARLERPARDKHSSILQTFINYGRKKFYNAGSGACTIKLFYGRIKLPGDVGSLELRAL